MLAWLRRYSYQSVRLVCYTNLVNASSIIPEPPQSDHFRDLIDGRTNSLFKSLGVDSKQIEHSFAENKASGAPLNPSKKGQTSDVDVSKLPFISTQLVYENLRKADFSKEQAEIITQCLDQVTSHFAHEFKQTSVPESASANETYLFDAASSEMYNEVQAYRRGQLSVLKSAMTRLQRDIEILSHEGTEMCNQLKADLDIEFFERKNQSRIEENAMQIRIQDLNNKISTRLNSELKSEIENLRWHITRRSLLTVAFVTASVIYLIQRGRSAD